MSFHATTDTNTSEPRFRRLAAGCAAVLVAAVLGGSAAIAAPDAGIEGSSSGQPGRTGSERLVCMPATSAPGTAGPAQGPGNPGLIVVPRGLLK